MALCVIDSIQSTGVRYSSVEKVIARYRRYRDELGADANQDGIADLLESFTVLGGPTGWARAIGNQNKTSTRSGAPLKANAIQLAGEALQRSGIDSTGQFRDVSATPSRFAEIEQQWIQVPGQGSRITWHYVQMLAGLEGIKPDRMIQRFVADVLDLPRSRVSASFALSALQQAASEIGMRPNDLDHAVWQWQRRR